MRPFLRKCADLVEADEGRTSGEEYGVRVVTDTANHYGHHQRCQVSAAKTGQDFQGRVILGRQTLETRSGLGSLSLGDPAWEEIAHGEVWLTTLRPGRLADRLRALASKAPGIAWPIRRTKPLRSVAYEEALQLSG